jgi:hypothetical protein
MKCTQNEPKVDGNPENVRFWPTFVMSQKKTCSIKQVIQV